MIIRIFLFRCSMLFFLLSFVGAELVQGVSMSVNPVTAVSVVSSSQQPTRDVTGTWSGTFQSRQPNFSPFTITVVINADPTGHLVGTSSVSSDCLKDGSLQVTVSRSKVVLAGGDAEGNHITFTGTIDETGTLLELNYVLNSSASARCESDDGTGTMIKR